MIAAWMLYCSLCAVAFALAALLVERTLLSGRASVRFIWVGAVALSLLVPGVAFLLGSRQSAANPQVRAADSGVVTVADAAPPSFLLPIATVPRSVPARDWRATLARLDEPLAIAWATLSLAVAFDFFGGIIVLAWMRRKWRQRVMLGTAVLVSERTGPAVVGALSPEIVVPEWVLGLEPSQLSLMLRHEQEHRRAGDGRLLAAAQLALIAMPWNLALWWQTLRLRVAVELDCDARVLREADARSYGDLLLEMARPRQGPSFIGATAFAERATHLERRIRMLARHATSTPRAARAIAASVALVALTGAWVAPRPDVPTRAPAVPSAPTADKVEQRVTSPSAAAGVETSAAPATPDAAPPRVQDSPPPTVAAMALALPDRNFSDPPAAPPTTVLPCARAGGPEVPPQVDAIFHRLFDGIPLPPDREARACDVIHALYLRRMLHEQSMRMADLSNLEKRTQRDADLRALLSNDADRAILDERLAQMARAGRGGRGGGGIGVGRGGGTGVGRGGGVGVGRGVGGGVGARGGARSGGVAADTFARIVGRARGAAGTDTFTVTMRAGGRGRGVATDTGLMANRARVRTDTFNLTMRGGRGVARGGGRGRGGSTPDSIRLDIARASGQYRLSLNNALAESTFRRLFEGIQLTPEQEARARELISSSQPEAQPARARAQVILQFNPETGVVSMQAGSAAQLMALVSGDAHRTTLQSRITVVPE